MPVVLPISGWTPVASTCTGSTAHPHSTEPVTQPGEMGDSLGQREAPRWRHTSTAGSWA